jgi:glycosyltransferase involved in cell wall biosynthesis
MGEHQRKRVFFFVNEFGLTGSETLLSQFIQDLSKDTRYSICVITTKKSSILGHKITQNIQFKYFSSSFSFIDKVKAFFNIDVIGRKLKKLLGSYPPDIIYLNTINNAYLLPFLKKYKAKKILHIHELLMGLNSLSPGDFNSILQQTDELVACSDLVAKLYRDIYSGRITLINSTQLYNWINPISVKNVNVEKRDKIKIVCAGTICYRKGFDRFLEAAEMLSDDQYELYWYGQFDNSAYSSWVNQKLNLDKYKHVHVQSFATQELYLEALTSCDLFLFTSREESMGMVLMDAIASKLPIISLETNGSTLIVQGPVNKIIPLNEFRNIELYIHNTIKDQRESISQIEQPFQYQNEYASFKALMDRL